MIHYINPDEHLSLDRIEQILRQNATLQLSPEAEGRIVLRLALQRQHRH